MEVDTIGQGADSDCVLYPPPDMTADALKTAIAPMNNAADIRELARMAQVLTDRIAAIVAQSERDRISS